MSINVMTMDEINEVSGAVAVPTWLADASAWSAACGVIAAPFPIAVPYAMGGCAAGSIGWDIGTWFYDYYWMNRQLF